jgi:hypothetical protein
MVGRRELAGQRRASPAYFVDAEQGSLAEASGWCAARGRLEIPRLHFGPVRRAGAVLQVKAGAPRTLLGKPAVAPGALGLCFAKPSHPAGRVPVWTRNQRLGSLHDGGCAAKLADLTKALLAKQSSLLQPSTGAGTSSMDETQTEESGRKKSAADTRSEARSEETVSGMEINLGDFTRTQGLMKSLRLTLNNQIVVQVEEIASGVGEAGRKFKMGDMEQANQDVARLYSAFGQKTNQWESQARNLEQQMKMEAAKNPKSVSIDKINRMKSEQTAVRTRIRTAEVQFRRLHQGLDQAFTNLQRQSAPTTGEMPSALPSGFLVPFKAAMTADRPEIVKRCFDIETVLKVSVSRGTKAGYDIKFDPTPPLDRLYFLTKTAQVIRLQQLSNVVVIQDLETGQKGEMKLVEFVKQVQSGIWLLKPRSGARQGNWCEPMTEDLGETPLVK